jgi:hypothetical protein
LFCGGYAARWSRDPSSSPLAAAIILIVCGLSTWTYFYSTPHRMLTAAAAHTPLVGSYTLARSRNTAQAVDLELPAQRGTIQLQLLPSNPVANQQYSAHLVHLSSGHMREPLDNVSGLTVSTSDLYVTVYLDSGGLAAGDYEISLEPPPDSGGAPQRFILRLR